MDLTESRWTARESLPGHWQVVDGNTPVAGIYCASDDKAKAHLIAQAPEMLKTLQWFVACLDDDSCTRTDQLGSLYFETKQLIGRVMEGVPEKPLQVWALGALAWTHVAPTDAAVADNIEPVTPYKVKIESINGSRVVALAPTLGGEFTEYSQNVYCKVEDLFFHEADAWVSYHNQISFLISHLEAQQTAWREKQKESRSYWLAHLHAAQAGITG